MLKSIHPPPNDLPPSSVKYKIQHVKKNVIYTKREFIDHNPYVIKDTHARGKYIQILVAKFGNFKGKFSLIKKKGNVKRVNRAIESSPCSNNCKDLFHYYLHQILQMIYFQTRRKLGSLWRRCRLNSTISDSQAL